MRELIDAFFRERSIVNHHIASFNDFLPTIDNPNSRMQRIVDNLRSSPEDERRGIIKLDEDRTEGDVIEIRIGRKRDDRGRIDLEAKPTITLGLPVVKEANGATHPLNPMEARLRNLNYTAPIYLDFTVIENGIEREPERVHIGNFPIMVKSKRCLLYKENMETEGELTSDEYKRKLIEMGEDPYDPGGYFIIGGTERALISLEDLAPNRVLVEFNERYGRKVEVAKVFSQKEGYRALTLMEKKKDDQLPVLLLLHQGEGPVAFLLGEDLRDLDLAAVALVEFDQDAVRGEVFERDQGPLRPADDEVPARVVRIFAHLDELPLVLVGGELPFRLHVLFVEEAPLRLDHDGEVADVDPLRLPFDTVLDDREVEVDRRGVVQVPQPRLHRIERMRGAVGLLDDGQAQRDRRLRLEVDPAAVVPLPADPDLDHVAFGPVLVELDDASAFVFGRRSKVVHDPLHSRVRIVDRGKEVVERGDVMVDDGAFSEERIDEFAHALPPDDEAISLRHTRGPAHPRHANDPAFLDGPLDLLEDLDHGIALPNLRELVSRDLHRLQDPLRLFLRHEAMLWN